MKKRTKVIIILSVVLLLLIIITILFWSDGSDYIKDCEYKDIAMAQKDVQEVEEFVGDDLSVRVNDIKHKKGEIYATVAITPKKDIYFPDFNRDNLSITLKMDCQINSTLYTVMDYAARMTWCGGGQFYSVAPEVYLNLIKKGDSYSFDIPIVPEKNLWNCRIDVNEISKVNLYLEYLNAEDVNNRLSEMSEEEKIGYGVSVEDGIIKVKQKVFGEQKYQLVEVNL